MKRRDFIALGSATAWPLAARAQQTPVVGFLKTLRVTPAMAAGVTDKLWEIGDVVKVLEDWETAE